MKKIYSIIFLIFLVLAATSCSYKYGSPISKSRNTRVAASQQSYKYKYVGTGHFTELTRTYIPGVAETHGFMIDFKPFIPKSDIYIPYFLEVLPKQIETLHIDLALAIPNVVLNEEEEQEVMKNIPQEHKVRCALIESDTRKIITSAEMRIHDFPRYNNRKLCRGYIVNLLEIPPNTIEEGTALEIRFEYFINNKPLKHEMMLLVTMDAPTA